VRRPGMVSHLENSLNGSNRLHAAHEPLISRAMLEEVPLAGLYLRVSSRPRRADGQNFWIMSKPSMVCWLLIPSL